MGLLKQILNENQRNYRKEIDIQSMYDKYNTKLFNGELPKILVKWRTMKRAGGNTHEEYVKGIGWKPKMIQISDYFIYDSDEVFDGILVHEMIHVWVMELSLKTGEKYKPHGKEFMNKLRELQSKCKFKIPITHEINPIGINKPVKKSRGMIG